MKLIPSIMSDIQVTDTDMDTAHIVSSNRNQYDKRVWGGPFFNPITIQYSTAVCGLKCKLLFSLITWKGSNTKLMYFIL